MSKYFKVVYFDRFAEMFVTEKDPFAAPERYQEISVDYLNQLFEQIKDQGEEIEKLKKTHIVNTGSGMAIGEIHGGMTIHRTVNQTAKEIHNVKHVEVFNA